MNTKMLQRWQQGIKEEGERALSGHWIPRDDERVKLCRKNKRLKEENVALKKLPVSSERRSLRY